MKLVFFDTHRFDREAFDEANQAFGHQISFFEPRLDRHTARLSAGFRAVCVFVNDQVDAPTLEELKRLDLGLVALRSAGFNNVDLEAAQKLGIRVVRVPEYSPHAVAEHAVALVMALNRKIYRAYARVREGNFSLDGLVGFDLYGKTVGIVGTGRIGGAAAQIFSGFGCRVLAYDQKQSAGLAVTYVPLEKLLSSSDIVSLHVPLNPKTHHLIDAGALARMRRGAMLINTGRGALIDTPALISALKSGQVGAAGLDVYEEEEGIFFKDLSTEVIQDDVLARLLTFPNVVVTAHQAFLTREALANIAQTTLANVSAYEKGEPLLNEVLAQKVVRR